MWCIQLFPPAAFSLNGILIYVIEEKHNIGHATKVNVPLFQSIIIGIITHHKKGESGIKGVRKQGAQPLVFVISTIINPAGCECPQVCTQHHEGIGCHPGL